MAGNQSNVTNMPGEVEAKVENGDNNARCSPIVIVVVAELLIGFSLREAVDNVSVNE